MKISTVDQLALDGVKVVTFDRFKDERGYFTESYRKSDMADILNAEIVQINESFSHAGVLRGLHFQWSPFMGKLVRTMQGHMIDLVLDIRKGSPTYGHIIAYDMPATTLNPRNTWIWVPPGFAHGNIFLTETTIEYLCTGAYNPNCEAGITPLDPNLDWSFCEPELKKIITTMIEHNKVTISNKDKKGLTLDQWKNTEDSDQFIYGG